jgi:hypothetical protein
MENSSFSLEDVLDRISAYSPREEVCAIMGVRGETRLGRFEYLVRGIHSLR